MSSAGHWWYAGRWWKPSDSSIACLAALIAAAAADEPVPVGGGVQKPLARQPPGALPLETAGDEQGPHLPRLLVQVALGDPSADLSLAYPQEHCARRWPVGPRQRCELGSRTLVAAHSLHEPREIARSGHAASPSSGHFGRRRPRRRRPRRPPRSGQPSPTGWPTSGQARPVATGGRDEVGEHDQVVLVVAGRAVERPTAGDQPQPGVVDVGRRPRWWGTGSWGTGPRR